MCHAICQWSCHLPKLSDLVSCLGKNCPPFQFKAISSPAYIIAMLDNCNEGFFCPVKKCFEFACEASAKGKAAAQLARLMGKAKAGRIAASADLARLLPPDLASELTVVDKA